MHHLLDEILPRVTKPARYIGGEVNAVIKDCADVRFALAFPDIYEIGMSNFGLRILYEILNARPDTLAERVFAPWVDMEAEMRSQSLPLSSLETQTPLRSFDIIGFSLGYELNYTNVLNMLDLGGIPLLTSERDKTNPLVIAGGCCAFNPEPMSDFIDAFVIGDGEEVIHDIVETYKAYRREPRNRLLRQLAEVPGVYVPSFYQVNYHHDGMLESIRPVESGVPEVVTKRVVLDLDSAPHPERPVIPFIETVHDRVTIEVMRGCTRGCRFCQAGVIYRPVRQRSADRIISLANILVANTGYDEISLLSLSTPDYYGIEDLVYRLAERYHERRIGLSLPSIRTDAPCVGLMSEIQKVRKSGLTLAPEAGTQRMRDVINKTVTESDLLAAVESAFRNGWRKIKLYFMIGLPGESDEDIAGIARTAAVVAQFGRRMRVKPTINVSVSTFVPKPHTPFQWRSQDSLGEIVRKQALLRQALKIREVSLSWHDPHSSFLEAVLSRGDRRVGKAILAAWRRGCRMDAWHEHFDYQKWAVSFDEVGILPEFYANRPRGYDEVLPWHHIDCGVSIDFLVREDIRAQGMETTPDCRLIGQCWGCGMSRLVSGICVNEVSNAPCVAETSKG